MIKIDHTLLSDMALENLLIEFITRESTDYGENEQDIQVKKTRLLRKLETEEAVLVYFTQEVCNIITAQEWLKLKKKANMNLE